MGRAIAGVELNIKGLTDHQLVALTRQLMDERLQRAVETGDPDVLVALAMQEMFTSSGEPTPPKILNADTVAIPGMIQYTSAEKHTCRLYTVRAPNGGTEGWSWDEDNPTFVHGDSSRVDKSRRSVHLHLAIDGLVLIQHSMRWDGERHNRVGCRAWSITQQVDERTGELLLPILAPISDWTPSHLPPPNGEGDDRSYAGRATK